MAATRRLAAILAADVAGYSRLMGADEEGTLERLKALRRELLDPKIAEHHGRIVKTTGDGFLIEFASVVDAVRCAIEVQQAMPERNTGVAAENRIELRIGINLGDVIVEGDDLYGDGVNIAARIEGLADAGGVLVSNTVHDHVRDRLPFVFEDLGEQQVKNIARPVQRLPGSRGRPPPYPPPHAGEGSAPGAQVGAAELPPRPPQQAFDRGIAVRQYERRPGAGIFRRRHGRGDHHRALAASAGSSSSPAIRASPTRAKRSTLNRSVESLGVRYVLEGSVRKASGQVRITAQLIDAQSGAHLWADHFDGALEHVFELQDQVAASVAGAIEPALASRPRSAARGAERPTILPP